MKRMYLYTVATFLLLFVATGSVTAAPPTGVIALDVVPSEHTAISIPYTDAKLHAEAGTGVLFAVRKWDPLYQVYTEAWLSGSELYEDVALTTPSAMELIAGDGIFLSHASVTTQRLYITGSIVVDKSVTTEILPGLNLVGSPFASATATNDLPQPVSYVWPFLPEGDALPTAAAVWKNNTSDVDILWEIARPYHDAFSTDGLLAMTSAPGESGFELVVPAEKQVTIITKELAPDATFNALSDWQILAENLKPTDGSVLYIDESALEPADGPLSPARYYLAIDTTTDSDNDGVSDGLETFIHGTSPVDPPILNNGGGLTYYVNVATGDDGNDGLSSSTPKATINAATALATAGDHLVISAGHYSEIVTIPSGVSAQMIGAVQIQL